MESKVLVYKSAFIPAAVICIMYVLLWIAPILLVWLVSMQGYDFSYVGRKWQSQNILLVGYLVGLAILVGISSGLLFLKFFSRYFVGLIKPNVALTPSSKHTAQTKMVFIIALTALSAVGLFKSFGGTIFDKTYTGPTFTWLNIGAWSVIYLICLASIFGEYLTKNRWSAKLVLLITLMFFPILLCGSRIDFLSFMIAITISILCISNEAWLIRLYQVSLSIIWSLFVGFYTGQIRYSLGNITTDILTNLAQPESKLFYLSTIGDIGASVFQVVGLIHVNEMSFAGLASFFNDYFLRLVPGFIINNRPSDFASLSLERLGGGALHAIGEGYLIFGLLGVIFVSAFFGVLGALSGLFAVRFKSSPSAVSWLLFAFPWIILIRGGWYQFFAVFKSLEVLIIFLLILTVLGTFTRIFLNAKTLNTGHSK